MRILITGAAGMLGADLTKTLQPDHDLILTDITGDMQTLDITDTDAVIKAVSHALPDVVIHSAAYTDVDGCERDPDRAFCANAFGTWNIAAACRQTRSAMVYISTDFVFDGTKGEPYTEFDCTNPISHYGASKLAGEGYVNSLCPKHYIVRTAWLYGVHGKSFPRTMLNLSKTRKELSVVADQIGSPTFTADLARKVSELIHSPLYGTYHVTNKGACSWCDFARTTLSLAGINDVEVKPIRSDEWPSPTKRPECSVLRHYALEMQGRDDLRTWEDALADFVEQVKPELA